LQQALFDAMHERNYEGDAARDAEWRQALAAAAAEAHANNTTSMMERRVDAIQNSPFPTDDELERAVSSFRAASLPDDDDHHRHHTTTAATISPPYFSTASSAHLPSQDTGNEDDMLSAAVEFSMWEQRNNSIALSQGGDDEDELMARAIAASLNED
jgi:hypothetical protein